MLTEEKIKEIMSAKKQISEGSLTIWQTRLQTLVDMGENRSAFRFLQTPTEPQEDINFSCPTTNTVAGCGASGGGNDILSDLPPPPPTLPSVDD